MSDFSLVFTVWYTAKFYLRNNQKTGSTYSFTAVISGNLLWLDTKL